MEIFRIPLALDVYITAAAFTLLLKLREKHAKTGFFSRSFKCRSISCFPLDRRLRPSAVLRLTKQREQWRW